ncbi:MAG: hypothetical protein PHD82_14965, partial [Candidatus Riflebacteria bacterium]|nr:hypothetical protein [Candidatus Riflebacteria bacterium]
DQQANTLSGFAQKSALERLMTARQADENGGFSDETIDLLLKGEKNEFVRFHLEVTRRGRELALQHNFSPVSLLQKNFIKTNPDWHEVAVGLSALQNRPARLAAPILQHKTWQSWRPEILPVVLDFIGRTGQTLFSPQVASLIRHPRPEIRFFALRCLEQINPEELGAILPEVFADRSTEIAALAGQLQTSINTKLSGTVAAAAQVRRIPGANQSRSPLWLHQVKSPYKAIAAVICLLALLLIFNRPETEKSEFLPPTASKPVVKELKRFAPLKKPVKKGEERLIFGKIETVKTDSLVVHSPALQKKFLIRCTRPPQKKENDHFNGRVKINDTGSSLIEAVLIENHREK